MASSSAKQKMSFLLLILMMMQTLSGQDTDPTATAPAECSFAETPRGLKADCSGLGLTTVPPDLPEETAILDLSRNGITTLHNSSFHSLPNLVVLDLTKNHITIIEDGSLRCLLKLQQLSLPQNNIGDLKDNLLRNNQHLHILDLTNNMLTEIPMSTISPLKELNVLDMGENRIQFLNFTGFKSENLSSVQLQGNYITTIDTQDFYPLENASKLSLSQNKIKTLPKYTFSHLKHVSRLSLTNNYIEIFSLMPFLGMTSLTILLMSANNISRILPVINSTENLLNIPKIRSLSLQGNKIPVIPSKAFDGLDELENLDISQCRIMHLQNDSFAGLTSLKFLNLMNNKIIDIHSRMFNGLSQLQTLKFSNNELTAESAVQIKGLRTLQNLALDGNHIEFLTSLVWDLPYLPALDLSNNAITRLNDDSFLGIANLTNLTLAKNPIAIIKNDAFRGLLNLERLDLSAGGHIGSFASPFASLRQVLEIYLSGTSLDPGQQTFLGLDSLQRLYLSKCELSSDSLWDSKKNVSIFSTVSQLEVLYLSGNALNEMHPGTFHQLENVATLRLDHCSIAVLHPRHFSKFVFPCISVH